MSNELLFANLLIRQACSKATGDTKAPGEGKNASHQYVKTLPRGKQEAISDSKQLKLEYNRLLARELKAEDYLSSSDRTPEEIDKWLPEFNRLCLELSSILEQLDYTQEEAINGFTVKSYNDLEIRQHDSKTLRQEEFKQIFEDSGLSQRQFANHLGVTQQAVSKILKGKTRPSKNFSNKIRAAFQDLIKPNKT